MLFLFIFHNTWILFVLAFIVMKFACHGRQCSRQQIKHDHRPPGIEGKKKPLYDEDDLVPDGQNGFK